MYLLSPRLRVSVVCLVLVLPPAALEDTEARRADKGKRGRCGESPQSGLTVFIPEKAVEPRMDTNAHGFAETYASRHVHPMGETHGTFRSRTLALC